MNELAAEWVAKAEADFATASRERRVRLNPNYDAVCFHAQQCAEKYLKAVLQQHGVPPPRTHSLVELLELTLPLEPGLELQRARLVILDRYAVRYRYPGESANLAEAREALERARQFRAYVRERFGFSA